MTLLLPDLLIIIFYILISIFIGFWMSRRSAKGLKDYFVGNNNMKWYWLGLSNSSGMFDVNAVSWRVALLLMYGIQSVWIPWVWPVWNQVFVMIFLSTWLRRSGAMTGAEWMRIRFGDNTGGKLSHIIVVVFAVTEVIISIGIFFAGTLFVFLDGSYSHIGAICGLIYLLGAISIWLIPLSKNDDLAC